MTHCLDRLAVLGKLDSAKLIVNFIKQCTRLDKLYFIPLRFHSPENLKISVFL